MPSMNGEDHCQHADSAGKLSRGFGVESRRSSAAQSRGTAVPRSAGQEYWRSLDQLADTAEFRQFMHREFPAGATNLLESDERRQFLKIMGASMALAGMGLAGCRRWPEQHIMPFTSRPADRIPGVAQQYATCIDIGGVARGVIATSSDGRPTKLEGNPDHPTSRGAADILIQASVLDLYDPDRSRGAKHNGNSAERSAFDSFAADHFGRLRSSGGSGLAILTEANSSPTFARLRQSYESQFPAAGWFEYEPINNDSEVAGATLAFGSPHRTVIDYSKATIVVSLDADFLGTDRNCVQNIRGFAQARRAVDAGGTAHGAMNRLYMFESGYTVTGANADERAAVRASEVGAIAATLAGELAGTDTGGNESSPAAVKMIEHVLDDLRSGANRGKSVIVAGSHQTAEVHYLAHLLNESLGNVGTTVHYTPMPNQSAHVDSIRQLADAIRAGSIDTLVILGGNPVYNAPADLNFAALLKQVDSTVHLGLYEDETAALCTWHVNQAHWLEAWGDGRAWDGTYSVAQPLILPLFDGVSAIEMLAMINGSAALRAASNGETGSESRGTNLGQQLVRETFSDTFSSDDAAWRSALHDGFVAGASAPAARLTVNRAGLTSVRERIASSASSSETSGERGGRGGWEVVFVPHPTVYDGRFANNGWLQEAPDPMTRLTWDNAVLMNVRTAEALGLGENAKEAKGAMVTVSVNGRSIDAAVMVLPGLPDKCVTLHLGYGRSFAGRICADAGFDFYQLRTSDTMGFATGASVTATGEHYALATVQDHHTIDVDSVGGKGAQSRLPTLLRAADLAHYKHDPDFAKDRAHIVHRLSLWEEDLSFQRNPDGREGNYAWAMSIDLNSCVGCGACVVACQAENNIPVVGKEQVIKGREMHWLRVDRYFKFEPIKFNDRGDAVKWDPDRVVGTAMQPVPCMHCENAPCEQVCPVAATVHDSEGLNVMIYNRCVGTRYCSNNCPYKVRRFNYFDWHRRQPTRTAPGMLLQVQPDYYTEKSGTPNDFKRLQFNPEVSVRMRGVMEKCTYCVQRIAGAKIEAKNAFAQQSANVKESHEGARVPIPDGTITPACAQTCPAEAIIFGDMLDPNSRINQRFAHPRSYEMLEELNVKARTRYLAKVRNPHGGGQAETSQHGHASSNGH